MTFSTLAEFIGIDNDILNQNMRVVTDSTKNYISAIIDVLGKENHEAEDSSAHQLHLDIIRKLMELYDLLKKRGDFDVYTSK